LCSREHVRCKCSELSTTSRLQRHVTTTRASSCNPCIEMAASRPTSAICSMKTIANMPSAAIDMPKCRDPTWSSAAGAPACGVKHLGVVVERELPVGRPTVDEAVPFIQSRHNLHIRGACARSCSTQANSQTTSSQLAGQSDSAGSSNRLI
jgi:hypothetical protein